MRGFCAWRAGGGAGLGMLGAGVVEKREWMRKVTVSVEDSDGSGECTGGE
jgi:hypothetical protein